ncbi:MAG TPA: serine/threonine-protein kinase [Polyangiaceae bacterium]|nr:serine/threonine-protein kinase [Polyangiaceae bacterium]
MSAPLPSQPETVLDGKYRLGQTLAVSSFGAVYDAEDLSVGKRVALKVLHRALDADGRTTFFNASRAVARLSHPNLVSILAIGGSDEHAPYLVMEHLAGETLQELVTREGPLSALKLADLALDLFAGLAALHAGGVLHGNLSPRNVFVTYPRPQRPQLKLLGLGVPSACREPTREPGYMRAASQLGAATTTERSDVYAASAILFFMATGRAPTSPIDPLMTPLPDSIRECVSQGMGSDPLVTPSSAADLMQQLRQRFSNSADALSQSGRQPLLREGYNSVLQTRTLDVLGAAASGAPRPALLRAAASDRLVSDSLLLSPRVPKPPGSPKLELGLDFMPSPGDPVLQAELEKRHLPTEVPVKSRWFGALSATALGFTVGVALARLLGLI